MSLLARIKSLIARIIPIISWAAILLSIGWLGYLNIRLIQGDHSILLDVVYGDIFFGSSSIVLVCGCCGCWTEEVETE